MYIYTCKKCDVIFRKYHSLKNQNGKIPKVDHDLNM